MLNRNNIDKGLSVLGFDWNSWITLNLFLKAINYTEVVFPMFPGHAKKKDFYGPVEILSSGLVKKYQAVQSCF